MRDVLIGQTDYTVLVKIIGTDGAPETGLAHTDIDIAYSRVETDNDVTTSDVSPANLSALTDAHSDWGWEEVSSTDHPGLYRLDIADAVFASGAWEAVVTITDASGTDFYPVDIGFRLVSFNAQDGVRLGLTALPNAAADAAGGLPISDAGGLDLDAKIGALTFTVAGEVNANTRYISGDATAATNQKNAALALRSGAVATADSTPNTATSFDTNLPQETDNYYGNGNGGLVVAFVGGTAQQYQTRRIVASTNSGANTRITLEESLDGTPTDTDAFVCLGRITELS